MKALYILISVVLGNILRTLRKRLTALLTLANTLLRCFSNVDLKSNIDTKVFLFETHYCRKLKVDLFDLRLKMISWACFLGSGLKLIFYWKAQSLTFFKSSFKFLAEVFTS